MCCRSAVYCSFFFPPLPSLSLSLPPSLSLYLSPSLSSLSLPPSPSLPPSLSLCVSLLNPSLVPAPESVVIATSSSPPYKAGNDLQLTCTVTLPNLNLNYDKISAQITWRKGDHPINISNPRISVEDSVTSGNSRVQHLTIDPLSDKTDSGDYVCDLVLSVNDTDITSPLTSSDETLVTVEGV